MKACTFKGRRFAGTALAALTVVAGMSAVAFAGEPEIPMTKIGKAAALPGNVTFSSIVKAIPAAEGESLTFKILTPDGAVAMDKKVISDTDTVDMDLKMLSSVESVEVKIAQIKVDEETGDTYVSFDEGKTWEKMEAQGEAVVGSMVALEKQVIEEAEEK